MRIALFGASLIGACSVLSVAAGAEQPRSFDISNLREKTRLNKYVNRRRGLAIGNGIVPSKSYIQSTAKDNTRETIRLNEARQKQKALVSTQINRKLQLTATGMGSMGMGMGMSNSKGKRTSTPTVTPSSTISPSPSSSSSSSSSLVPSTDYPTFSPTKCVEKKKKVPMMMMMVMGKGGMGMFKSGMKMKVNVCPDTPSLSLVPSSSYAPSPSSIVSSIIPTTIVNDCVPTSGNCASTATELQNEIDLATAGDVIAVCNGTVIGRDTVFILDQPSTTLCCAGRDCTLQGLGSDSVLFVTGSSVTILGMRFQFGFSSLFNGGNVAIEAGGDHVIAQSEFVQGNTSFAGGNLFVETNGTITITDTTFVSGKAQNGGGVVILNASEVVIASSLFVDNTAENGGAFYYAGEVNASTSPLLLLQDSIFIGNNATVGGALLFVDIVTPPASISIINNDFSQNTAAEAGGAGVFLADISSIGLELNLNVGSGNTATILCDDFLAFLNPNGTQTQCIGVAEILP